MFLRFFLLLVDGVDTGLLAPTASYLLPGTCNAHFSTLTYLIPGVMYSVMKTLGMVYFYRLNLWLAISLLGSEH